MPSTKNKASWAIEKVSEAVCRLRVHLKGEQRVLFVSDSHVDHPHNAWNVEREHLDEALRINAPVIHLGDRLDLMQGRNDKRRGHAGMRRELQKALVEGESYSNAVLDFAESRYAPYASILAANGVGNHETKYAQMSDVDLASLFVERMQNLGSPVVLMPYLWFMRIAVTHTGTVRESRDIFCFHGSGGNSPVTGGVLNTGRRQIAYDADYYVSGHLHRPFEFPLTTTRINGTCTMEHRERVHLQIAGYHDDRGGFAGWSVEKGMQPSTPGAWWMVLSVKRGRLHVRWERAT